jgi:hypothetical protein
MKAFNHSFKSPLSDNDIQQMNGFILALRALQGRLEEMTQYRPEKRYIDAIELLEAITATTDEFNPMMAEAQREIVSKLATF